MTISGGISFGGLGSGLDTNAIIEALLGVERVPIDALEAKKSNEQKKASLVGTIQGYVDTLRSKAKALATMSDFLSVTASNPFENLATISASTTAAEGSHTLRVASTLATDRWAFSGVADPTADLASGAASLAFGYEGSLYTFNFGDPTQTSLNDVAAAINAGPNGGVTAQVLQTGPTGGATSYQLVLTAPEGGASHRLSAISSSGLGLTISSGVGSSSNVTTGEDAVAYIDGLRFQRESNDFSDVIAGVSIQALAPGQEFTFTISADKEAIQAKLQEFVDAYNEVITFINGQNAYSEDEGAGGLLFGDSLLRTVRGTLYNTLFGQTALQVPERPQRLRHADAARHQGRSRRPAGDRRRGHERQDGRGPGGLRRAVRRLGRQRHDRRAGHGAGPEPGRRDRSHHQGLHRSRQRNLLQGPLRQPPGGAHVRHRSDR